jgi:hypothetical protein
MVPSSPFDRIAAATAMTLALACMAPAAAHAKGSDDDGDHRMMIPATACAGVDAAGMAGSAKGGIVALAADAAAPVTLRCPVSLGRQSDSDDIRTFAIHYRNAADANVSIELVRTTLSTSSPGMFAEEAVCPQPWTSPATVPGVAAVGALACPGAFAKEGLYHFNVTIGAGAAFAGITGTE